MNLDVDMTKTITDGIKRVKDQINEACQKAGRSPEEITVVAVTKTFSPDVVMRAIDAGVSHIGENRMQEADEKLPRIDAPVTKHFIGHVQSNKARLAAHLFDWVHSIDRVKIARAIGQRAVAENKTIQALIQVNQAGDEGRHGAVPDEVIHIASEIGQLKGLQVRGLMTMAPFTDDEKVIRHTFRSVRELADKLREMNIPGVTMDHLSMGMSGDFRIAVEEGATMVRLGRMLFGARS